MQKILIIDDNKNNITSLESIIQEYIPNLKIISALSGEKGIELAKKENPNTILLDVKMPGLNGFETSKILKKDDATKNIPIILLTIYDTTLEEKKEVLNCGADVFFDKFFAKNNKILIAQIKSMLNINKTEKKLINEQLKLEKAFSIKSESLQNIDYKYKTIFESSGTANIIIENDMIISLCNSEVEKLTGFSKEEIEGKMKFSEFLKEPYQSLMEQYHIARRKGYSKIPNEYKFDIIDKFNNEKRLYLKIGLIPKTKQTIVSIMDITKTEKLKKTLNLNKTYFEELLKILPEAVAILDKNGKAIKLNNKFIELFGYTIKDFKNKNFDETISPTDLIDSSKHITSKTGLGEIISCETKRKHKNGKIIDISLISNSFEIEKGNKFVFGIYRDITERKKSEKLLKESQRTLSTLFDNLPGMSYRVKNDEDWTMMFVSQGCFELTGYKPDVFLKNKKIKFKDIIYHEDLNIVIDTNNKAIKTKQPYHIEYRIKAKDNKIKWVSDKGKCVFSKNKLQFIEGFISDITYRKTSEIELKKYNSIVSASKDRMAFIDKNYIYQAVNKAFCKHQNLSADKIINRHVKDIIGDDTFNQVAKPKYDLCLEGKDVHFQTWYKFPKAGKIYLDVILTPNYDDSNKIIGFSLITRNITELKNVQDDLIIAKEKAVESDKLKSAFLSNMSHEIRTPMNAIIGFSSLLSTPDLEQDEKEEYIKRINLASNNLLNLIDDILDISKIEANQLDINKSKNNLNKILYEIYCQFNDNEVYFEDKDINFLLNVELINNDFIIYTDRARLIQVFVNLINNAFKFTKKGFIEFGCSKITKQFIEFYVKDSGIGIAEDKINFIFDRFRQVDGSHTREFGGTGLGLAITENIIRLLNGEISVTSKIDSGSTFYFSLPIDDEELNKN